MEIRHLKLIKTLVESGTLSAAGKELFLSQPALSRQLRGIEDELGVSLFYRMGRKMVLTPTGEHLVGGAGRILSELETMVNYSRAIATGEGGLLRIVTSHFTCYHWLPRLLQQFRKKYPKVVVKIDLAAMPDPAKALKERDLDLGIVGHAESGPEFCSQTLFEDEDVIIVNSCHRWAKRKYVNPQELASEQLIVFDQDLNDSDLFTNCLIPAGVDPKHVVKMPMTETIIDMVKSDLGISLLTRWTAKPYLKSRELVVLRLTQKGIKGPWFALTLQDRMSPPYLQEFINLLKSAND
jgi:LysR family transcriptional regulator for metE and metH